MWPVIATALCGIVPPYPGPSIVPLVTIPPPAKLDPRTPLPECAGIVLRAYIGAMNRRFRQRYRMPRDVRASAYFFDLMLCADAMLEVGVAPAAWCAFSVDVWVHYVARGKPPITWVCDYKRVLNVEKHDWFLSELPRYDGGRLHVGEAHRDLLNRWWRMRRAVLSLVGRGAPLDRVRKLVQRHFPAGLWDMMVAGARTEALAAQHELVDKAKAGMSLW